MSPHRLLPACAAAGFVALAVSSGPAPLATAAVGSAASSAVCARAARGRLPLAFEENRGQTDPRVRFLVRDRDVTAFLCGAETVFALHSSATSAAGDAPRADADVRSEYVRMRLVGANDAPAVEARDPLPGKCNYFTGNDPSRWITDVPTNARVAVRDVWPGVDVVWHGGGCGRLTYDFVVAPGADADWIAFELEGARDLAVADDGSLVAATELGELRQTRPVAFQVVDGSRRSVDVAFAVTDDRTVRFAVGAHDARRPLVIDPSLTYSTYLGGSGQDYFVGGSYRAAIAVDGTGAAYIVGKTQSTDFPTQSAYQSSAAGASLSSAFVTKINSAGSAIVYSTYLTGTQGSIAHGIAVDGAGAAYVTGNTSSTDFPTQGALQAAHGGGTNDAFVTKLNAAGSALVYSTYLGGTSGDGGDAIAVDASGAAYVSGSTGGAFPTQGPQQGTYGGGSNDSFVAKIDSSGSALVYATYLGGNATDAMSAIAVDSSGNACVCGSTSSTNFPVQSPIQGTKGGSQDAFVAKINASGSALVWSTYLGGAVDGGGSAYDYGWGIAVDGAGAVYVVGQTRASDFPTVSPLQAAHAGGLGDAFVAKIGSSGSALAYSTFLGGSGMDQALAVAVDSSGAATVVGMTASTDFPTASPSQSSYGGGSYDAFVAKLDASGAALTFSTYLGGSAQGEERIGVGGIALDSTGNAYVTGGTYSTDFPTQSPLQSTYAGGGDVFVAKYPLGTGGGPITPVPSAPIDLVATYTEGEPVSLSWTDTSNDETGFRIERHPQGYAFAVLASTTANTTSMLDGLLYPNTTYTYRVRAFNAGGPSAWSNEVSITTGSGPIVPPPPLAPTVLKATPLEDGTVWLTWIDNSADELGFNLQRGEGGRAFATYANPKPGATSWIDETARPGWPQAYRIAAFSLQGPSPWSNTARATVPATIDLVVTSGTLVDKPKLRGDRVELFADYAMTAAAREATFDPVASGLELQVGPADAPLMVSIPPDDPGWTLTPKRERRGRPAGWKKATWTSPKPQSPKVKVVVDFKRQRLEVTVWAADFAQPLSPEMRLLLACGADGGAHEAEWPEKKKRTGTYKFPAK